jgi:hypothetical protein
MSEKKEKLPFGRVFCCEEKVDGLKINELTQRRT